MRSAHGTIGRAFSSTSSRVRRVCARWRSFRRLPAIQGLTRSPKLGPASRSPPAPALRCSDLGSAGHRVSFCLSSESSRRGRGRRLGSSSQKGEHKNRERGPRCGIERNTIAEKNLCVRPCSFWRRKAVFFIPSADLRSRRLPSWRRLASRRAASGIRPRPNRRLQGLVSHGLHGRVAHSIAAPAAGARPSDRSSEVPASVGLDLRASRWQEAQGRDS